MVWTAAAPKGMALCRASAYTAAVMGKATNMRGVSTYLLATALLGAVSPAAAQAPAKPATAAPAKVGSPTVTDDVRCLLTMVVLSQNKDRQQAGQLGAIFFLGRINGRAPTLDLAAAMKAQAPTMMQQQTLQTELARCGPMIQTSNQAFQNALTSLRPPGPPPGAAPPAPAPTPLPK